MTWHLDNGSHFSQEEVERKLRTKTVEGQLFFKVDPRCPWMIRAIGDCVATQRDPSKGKYARPDFSRSSAIGEILELRNAVGADGGVMGELPPQGDRALNAIKNRVERSQAQQQDGYVNPPILAITLPGEPPLQTTVLEKVKKSDIPYLKLDPETVGRFIQMVRNSTVSVKDETPTRAVKRRKADSLEAVAPTIEAASSCMDDTT